MDINQVDPQTNDNQLATDYDNRTEQIEEWDNFQPCTKLAESKPYHQKKIQQFEDDKAYDKSVEVIHQGTNLIDITLIVNQYETEYKQKFLYDVTLDDVVNYFKKVTGDDQLVPINFKIPRSQINNLKTKGEISLKMLIHNQNIYIKCQSNNQKYIKQEEEVPII